MKKNTKNIDTSKQKVSKVSGTRGLDKKTPEIELIPAPEVTNKPKSNAGRPTDYKPEYCQMAIDMGEQGKSKAQIAATLNVTRMTLDIWAKAHPEFLYALELSRDKALHWWESIAQTHLVNTAGASLNSAVWSRSMAARFPADYTEKKIQSNDPDNPINGQTNIIIVPAKDG